MSRVFSPGVIFSFSRVNLWHWWKSEHQLKYLPQSPYVQNICFLEMLWTALRCVLTLCFSPNILANSSFHSEGWWPWAVNSMKPLCFDFVSFPGSHSWASLNCPGSQGSGEYPSTSLLSISVCGTRVLQKLGRWFSFSVRHLSGIFPPQESKVWAPRCFPSFELDFQFFLYMPWASRW